MFRPFTPPATADPARAQLDQVVKACGHTVHVGACAACQRAQLAKWQEQLESIER